MTPLEKYQSLLDGNGFIADTAQQAAVGHTQSLYENLVQVYDDYDGLFSRFKRQFIKGKVREPVRGLYLWGGVGRGKTLIIDLFFDSLPFPEKQRIHFHRFMLMVHLELKKINNREDPLEVVADSIVGNTWVLCLDEFHVTDITDAMLLGRLLKALFLRGITLVTTSNEAPDELYAGGLQRERFHPVIDLIKCHTRVFRLDEGTDYRLRYLDKAETYHYPLDQTANEMLETNFMHIAPEQGIKNAILEIEGRDIETVCCADGVVWFDFDRICDGPRGTADYIELARQYQTVLIGGIPVLTDSEVDLAKRFMTLIDEFYDRQVKLIITAAAPPDAIYTGKKLEKPFARTLSRLQEMQTHDYLAKPHLS